MFTFKKIDPSAWKGLNGKDTDTVSLVYGRIRRPLRMSLLATLLTGTLITTQWLPGIIAPVQAVNFGALWERFFKTEPPEPPRDGSRGPDFCVPDPEGYDGSVWSDRPSLVFESQGGVSTIALYQFGESEPLWTQSLTADDQVMWVDRLDGEGHDIPVYHVSYDGADALSPEADYIWKVSSKVLGITPPQTWIKTLSEEAQGAIAQELATLETQLRQEGLDEDAIALQRADYFADRGLWGDFWHEVMGIECPPEEFQALMESALSTLCSEEAVR